MLGCASVWLCLCLLGLVQAQYVDRYEGDVCRETKGKKWICKKIKDCPKYQEYLNANHRPPTCAFVDNESLICCEPPRKSKLMCAKYGESVYNEVVDPYTEKVTKEATCTIVEPLISGGKDAQPREYPHMALIGYRVGGIIEWNCGGSLISDRYILSAAHCTDGGNKGKPKIVRLGEHNVQSTRDDEDGNAQPRDYEIIEWINHPNYRNVVYNDIALYKLKEKVVFNEFIRPICLNSEHQITRTFAIATGWGVLEQGGRRGSILQKVNLTFATKEKCSKVYPAGKGSLTTGLDGEGMLCAGNTYNDGDTCRGDSGGPLQIPVNEPYCMYTQIGITSFGKVCGMSKPGVFTRVSNYVPWIESIVWP